MTGTNRTITRRLSTALLLGALFLGALVGAAGASTATGAPAITGAFTATFPERVHGVSVAIAPDGVPWFGLSTQGEGPSLAHSDAGKLEIEALGEKAAYGETTGLQFDSGGALWFIRSSEGAQAIERRNLDGTLTEFPLPGIEPVNALTIGPEGDIWFVRGRYGKAAKAQVGRMTPTGALTQIPLEAGSYPTSITAGPDEALWFNEQGKGKIGRIATGSEVRLFELGPKVEPRQIVAGAEGALWFGENGQARRYGRISNRIGRITTSGEVTQFPVPFGTGTTSLAADPRGVVWFATAEGDVSSISPSGNVGARGCVDCGEPIESLALAADGSLWFAAAHAYCEMCGGGSDLIIENEGTEVGQVPAGALAPADPNGPPAVDPYKTQGKARLPVARTGKARDFGAEGAELTGYINSRGYPTTWLFIWGKTKKYGHKTFLPEFPFRAGEGAATVEEFIFNVCPSTTYHYELVAYGPGGRAYGGDRTFRTPRDTQPPKRCLAH
jgi:virginiamycin B lyase